MGNCSCQEHPQHEINGQSTEAMSAADLIAQVQQLDQQLKEHGIDAQKIVFEFSEKAYRDVMSICTRENAEKAVAAASEAYLKLKDNGVDLEVMSKDISSQVLDAGALLAAKMFDDAKTITVAALNDPAFQELAQ